MNVVLFVIKASVFYNHSGVIKIEHVNMSDPILHAIHLPPASWFRGRPELPVLLLCTAALTHEPLLKQIILTQTIFLFYCC